MADLWMLPVCQQINSTAGGCDHPLQCRPVIVAAGRRAAAVAQRTERSCGQPKLTTGSGNSGRLLVATGDSACGWPAPRFDPLFARREVVVLPVVLLARLPVSRLCHRTDRSHGRSGSSRKQQLLQNGNMHLRDCAEPSLVVSAMSRALPRFGRARGRTFRGMWARPSLVRPR